MEGLFYPGGSRGWRAHVIRQSLIIGMDMKIQDDFG